MVSIETFQKFLKVFIDTKKNIGKNCCQKTPRPHAQARRNTLGDCLPSLVWGFGVGFFYNTGKIWELTFSFFQKWLYPCPLSNKIGKN